MQPFNDNAAFTAVIKAYDSSNRLIGEVTESGTSGAFGTGYSIAPVGMSSTRPIKSIAITMTSAQLNAFAVGSLFFLPRKSYQTATVRYGHHIPCLCA